MTSRRIFEKSKIFTRDLEALVPGGAHTYSRGRDQFPLECGSGILRGEGAWLWDVDGNRLLDWSMGLTSVSLGHGHPSVTSAVCAAIQDGTTFSRPAELELTAARAFLDFAGTDMVKFAKHGSSVTTAAVKLARAFTGRAKVALPREQPFFSFDDWFISSTPADWGIPEALKEYTLRFGFNDLNSLHTLFAAHPGEIACVVMEPVKFDPPVAGFLEGVRELCTRNDTVLILDEMVTGLKFGLPGAAARFGVEGDLYTFGKGIANGFTQSALTGKGDIMRLGGLEPEGERKLFLLSSTHGSESSGLAAMIETLRVFRQDGIIERNWETGDALRTRLNAIIAGAGLEQNLRIVGYPCFMMLETLGPEGAPDFAFRTLFMQEAVATGVLFQGTFVLTPSHREQEIAATETAFEVACATYRRALDKGTVDGFLTGPAIKPVFRRIL